MANFSTELDFEPLPIDAIALSAEEINRAIQNSHLIVNQATAWQTYLQTLALLGFEQWLAQRHHLTLNSDRCSSFQPALANAIEATCNLQLNQFKLCLIAIASLNDGVVSIPRAVVDLPEYIAHFYVLVEVREEQETVTVSGFLSYDRFIKMRSHLDLTADIDWTYPVPLTWFDFDPDRLLLYLRCLEPLAIPLPAVEGDRTSLLSHIQAELITDLPQLQSAERQLWQVLTWEQGKLVLTSPDLLHWIYQAQQDPATEAQLRKSLTDLLQLVTQPAINAGRWLSDQLDRLAQTLSWVLLPSLAPNALRSPTEEFETIVRQLQQERVAIPMEARGAYQDLLLADKRLRLYALTWILSSAEVPEWSLLLILGTPSGTSLPGGVSFRVSDRAGVLVERTLASGEDYPYLYICVVGEWKEKFAVTLGLGTEVELQLPPFQFEPEL